MATHLSMDLVLPGSVSAGDTLDSVLCLTNTGSTGLTASTIDLSVPSGASIVDGAAVVGTEPPWNAITGLLAPGPAPAALPSEILCA